jgi:hypothetical protein
MNEIARIKLGEKLQVLLDMDEASATAEEMETQLDLCAPLEYLLQSLMEGQPGWDSRYSWIDGILPESVTRTSPGSVTISGLAVVVHAKEYNLRPVRAKLVRPPAISSICFAAQSTEFLYSPAPRQRYAAPTSWPYVFDVNLG